jgi:hypothetical protein
MKRNKIIDGCMRDKLKQHRYCIAFHEAGHAAAIYLNNKARNLPPIFFQIIFKDISEASEYNRSAYQSTTDDCVARVEGGRLIQSLPYTVDGMAHKLVEQNESLVKDYLIAYEADIINLLVGPLAEAKYVYSRDDEFFKNALVNLKSLKNYGGDSDLTLVNEYAESFSKCKKLQDAKMDELFTLACEFISDASNWQAIAKLADYILKSKKNIISCEEVASIVA